MLTACPVILATIGALTATGWLFKLIDAIERPGRRRRV